MITNWVTCYRHPIASMYIVYLKRLDGDIEISFFVDEEIAASHRIESSNSQAISNCSLSYLSKNDSQSDLSIKQDSQSNE